MLIFWPMVGIPPRTMSEAAGFDSPVGRADFLIKLLFTVRTRSPNTRSRIALASPSPPVTTLADFAPSLLSDSMAHHHLRSHLPTSTLGILDNPHPTAHLRSQQLITHSPDTQAQPPSRS